MFPRNENRNEGTFGSSTGTKTRKPPFYEKALLFPLHLIRIIIMGGTVTGRTGLDTYQIDVSKPILISIRIPFDIENTEKDP